VGVDKPITGGRDGAAATYGKMLRKKKKMDRRPDRSAKLTVVKEKKQKGFRELLTPAAQGEKKGPEPRKKG